MKKNLFNMGNTNTNSNKYDRNETIRNLEQKRNDIDDLWDDPRFDLEECVHAGTASNMIREHIEKLKDMNLKEEKFSNIYLDEYRNSDGSFNVYKVKRPLNCPSGNWLFRSSPKLFHQGVGIGKEGKIIFSDYGTAKENSDVRIWIYTEGKDNWADIEKVGTSNASNEEVKDIFFGKNSEKWVNHNDYNLFLHNCQKYANEKIEELIKK